MYDHIQSCKEILRHILYVSRLERILLAYKNLRGYKTDHLLSASLADRFDQIYATGVWINKPGQKSLSGLGSEAAVVKEIARPLSDRLRSLKAQSVLDVGCGDFRSFVDCQFNGHYIGVDIVDHLIEENSRRYGGPMREFRTLDAVLGPLPKADVVLLREVLFHLSFEDAKRMLRNVASSGAKYLIATNDKAIWFNSNISSGDFRRLNLMKSPFGLPAPSHEIDDCLVAPGRVLAIWNAECLPSF